MILSQLHTDDTISITYWNADIDLTHTHLYLLPNITCSLCTGCIYNSNKIQNHCTFNIPANTCTKFLGRKTPHSQNKLKLNANYLDLIYAIALRNPFTVPSLPSITLIQNPISSIFQTNSSSIKLQQIASKNI